MSDDPELLVDEIARLRGAATERRAGCDGASGASAARSGAGVSAAATITRTKATLWMTMPSGSLGIGSPKTRMPPLIAETLAAALVSVMTGTASPFCRPRAEAKKAIDRGDRRR